MYVINVGPSGLRRSRNFWAKLTVLSGLHDGRCAVLRAAADNRMRRHEHVIGGERSAIKEYQYSNDGRTFSL